MKDKDISILVPYKPDNGQRDKNWAWLKRRYEALMPNAEICIGIDYGEPFSRSAAINSAAKIATGGIFVIADNDIAFEVQQMETVLGMMENHAWIIPFSGKVMLDSENTNKLLEMDPYVSLTEVNFTNTVLRGKEYGAICIVPRKHFQMVKGFDEKFRGWGGEDGAFYIAMNTICGRYGRPENMLIWHLYHPKQPARPQGSLDLYKKYVEARGNKEAIQSLINKKMNSVD